MGVMRYRVYFTPLTQSDTNTYGAETEVTDYIKAAGVGAIRRSIDSSDYDIGVFAFADLELTAVNYNGYFNEGDTRSLFMGTRDRCKVRAVFEEVETVRDVSGTVLSETTVSTVTFRGLINEEGTRLNVTDETIRFKVLSRDSVLRTTQVSAGVVTNGMLFSAAMSAILNVPKITSALIYDVSEINPDTDLTIDDGTWFDGKPVKEALDALLLASNSALIILDDGTITIRSRLHNSDSSSLNLYGKNDLHYRENIIDLTDYNTGKQRMFTSFTVNTQTISDSTYVQAFGLRQKTITLDFMTNTTKEAQIATRLVDEWKLPKIEMSVKVATKLTRNLQLLDTVSVSYPLRVKPPVGKFLPVIGVTKIGETDQPLPYTFGAIDIADRYRFKILEIEDSVDSFTSMLKLRQTGTNEGDGYFDTPNNCIVGYAIVNAAQICVGGDACDTYNPATIGGAQVGCTLIA